MSGKKAQIKDKDRCMECGACEKANTRLSLNLVRSNRANEAIQFHKSWLEREPDNYPACMSVAFTYDFAGDYEMAYEYLKKAELMQNSDYDIEGVEIYRSRRYMLAP